MISYTIYIVDDEESIRQGVSYCLKKHYKVRTFSTAEAAISAMKKNDFPDLVLLDIGLPGMSGIEALKRIKNLNVDVIVIMITATEDINTVIEAMKFKAHDYVVKPIHMDTLKISVKNALETIKMRKEIQTLQGKYLEENMPCFIGESNAISDVMKFVGKVAKSSDIPVLILGETGTGKELIASAIHYKSPNFDGSFVSLNCAAIPKELLESELFGYEGGAFSGATLSGKKGFVEEAADGTIFLDEVGDLSLDAQAKLLRFLEKGEFYRVGATKKRQVKTRIISATNKDLNSMIEQNLFRRDLYYRLAVIKVTVPSLNMRRDDIIPIARHFLVEFSQKYNKPLIGFSPQTEEFFLSHEWEGNIRELKNLVERGVLVSSDNHLQLKDIGIEMESNKQQENTFPPLPDQGIDLNALEKYYIRSAYKKTKGNEKEAARLLNLSYYSFRYKRKKLNKI